MIATRYTGIEHVTGFTLGNRGNSRDIDAACYLKGKRILPLVEALKRSVSASYLRGISAPNHESHSRISVNPPAGQSRCR